MTSVQGLTLSVTPRGERDIVMTRLFNAPRRLVFDAWTTPELLRRWYGARGWSLPVCEIDLRPGGAYRYVMRGPDGVEVTLRGTYRDVDPPERLVSTEAFEGFSEDGWRPEDETVSTMLLTEQDGQTTWTLTTTYPCSRGARRGVCAEASLGRFEPVVRPPRRRPACTPPGCNPRVRRAGRAALAGVVRCRGRQAVVGANRLHCPDREDRFPRRRNNAGIDALA